MTNIETYRKAYNKMIEKGETEETFEEYLERAKRRAETRKAIAMGYNPYDVKQRWGLKR
jgi:hypothetical protein